METKNSKPVPLSEQWPEVQAIAEKLAKELLQKMNCINIRNHPEIEKEIGKCEYWRQGLLELTIDELQKSV